MKKQTQMILYVTVMFCCGIIFFVSSNFFSGEKKETEISSIPQVSAPKTTEEFMESDAKIPPHQFVLKEEDGYITVYRGDGKTFYDYTDILVEILPKKLQQEIKNGKTISDEEQLYHFLENYSS